MLNARESAFKIARSANFRGPQLSSGSVNSAPRPFSHVAPEWPEVDTRGRSSFTYHLSRLSIVTRSIYVVREIKFTRDMKIIYSNV